MVSFQEGGGAKQASADEVQEKLSEGSRHMSSKELSSPGCVMRWKYRLLLMRWKYMPLLMRVGNNAVALTQ